MGVLGSSLISRSTVAYSFRPNCALFGWYDDQAIERTAANDQWQWDKFIPSSSCHAHLHTTHR